jgi:hypothetical protein
MSTSKSKLQCCHYAKSFKPLILKLKVDTHRNVGADISFVSMFPAEEEYLYPPLTHLKPVGEADLIDKDKNVIGRLITVVPSFPNIDLAESCRRRPIQRPSLRPVRGGSARISPDARLEIHTQAALQNTSFNDT